MTFIETTPLDLNRATAAQLEKLPGIGPVLAARIVSWRETHGPFRTIEDLLSVPGIGPKLLESLRDKVTVLPP
ncbi:MAG: helix-hairpin-helix domain-containing protein [Candidatus Bipolaricaulota bacterium]|nr:helix-hairpin-helix domain-containing protein [Candidatus Bipolaricaulota bacterium]MDW8126482.1 helix-hairpin-helix domain-containing protein [Candidatus Bipolaricaulota bacterium]